MPQHKTPTRKNKRKKSDNTPTNQARNKKKPKEEKDMEDEISVVETLEKLTASIEFLTETVKEVKEELKAVKNELSAMKQLKEEVNSLKHQNTMLAERITQLEDYSRRDNIVITGIKENRGENCRSVVAEFLHECFEMTQVDIVRAHRLGPTTQPNRKLIVKLKNHEDKEKIMRNKRNLRDRNIKVFVDDHFSAQTARIRASLRPVLQEVKKVNPKAYLRGDKIYSDGRLFNHRQLHNLPIDVLNP